MRLQWFSHRAFKSYIIVVRLHYIELRASKEELDIFYTPILEHIIASIRRFNGKPNVKKRHPII